MRISRSIGIVLSVALVASAACGPKVSELNPSLPGDGTDNLRSRKGAAAADDPNDPWKGRELIAAPSAPAPAALSMPKVERFTLKNGLEVIAVHDDALPVVSMQLLIRAGKRQVSRDKVGLADFAASAMTRGTKSRDAARIAREIEAVGGSLQASANYESTLLSCKTLAKDARTCMSIVPDILANPSFPEAEVALVRRNLLASVRQRLDDASLLANAHFQAALWGSEHPRGWISSLATIDAIGDRDLRDWHKTWIRPNNAILAIAGSFDPATVERDLERAFGKWKSATLPPVVKGKAPSLSGMSIRLVDKPNETQSHIRFGHYGVAHTDARFFDALVVDYILGGGQLSSRLMKVVRAKEAKTYVASSTLERNLDRGTWQAATFTRSEETAATIKLVRDVIGELSEHGPSAAEVEAAVTSLAGSYATRFESATDVASALLAAEQHGFDESYVANYPLQIGKVDAQSATKLASQLLSARDAVLVIVGDAREVAPQLDKLGWSYETIAHTAPVSDWERQRAVDAQDAAPEQVASAKKLLEEALAAKGGKAKLEALKSYRWRGEAKLSMPNGNMPAKLLKMHQRPDKLRLEMTITGGPQPVTITTVLTEKTGWAQQPGPNGDEVHNFTAEQLDILSAQVWRDSELILLRQHDPEIVVTPLGQRTIAGQTIDAVALATKDGARKVILLIDTKTKLLYGMEYADQGVPTSERYSEYKKVGGIQVAHKRATKAPQLDMTLEVKSFEANPKLDKALFNKAP